MLNNLKKGDKIITSGGIIGKISKVNENKEMLVEISDQVDIRLAPGMVADLYFTKETPKTNVLKTNEKKGGLLSGILGNKK